MRHVFVPRNIRPVTGGSMASYGSKRPVKRISNDEFIKCLTVKASDSSKN